MLTTRIHAIKRQEQSRCNRGAQICWGTSRARSEVTAGTGFSFLSIVPERLRAIASAETYSAHLRVMSGVIKGEAQRQASPATVERKRRGSARLVLWFSFSLSFFTLEAAVASSFLGGFFGFRVLPFRRFVLSSPTPAQHLNNL